MATRFNERRFSTQLVVLSRVSGDSSITTGVSRWSQLVATSSAARHDRSVVATRLYMVAEHDHRLTPVGIKLSPLTRLRKASELNEPPRPRLSSDAFGDILLMARR